MSRITCHGKNYFPLQYFNQYVAPDQGSQYGCSSADVVFGRQIRLWESSNGECGGDVVRNVTQKEPWLLNKGENFDECARMCWSFKVLKLEMEKFWKSFKKKIKKNCWLYQ